MTRGARRAVVAAVALACTVVTGYADAQPVMPGADVVLDSMHAERGANIEVSLLTFGPGDAIFERFGHNALVLRDTSTGESYAYNWGLFDFNQPNFLGRFLSGNTRYWLGVFRTPELVASYIADNRSVRVQLLALTPTERGALLEFVKWNSQDDNAFYRYDYYLDNCSTRVRDALDRVLRGDLHRQLDTSGDGLTWRSETERLLAASLPAYAGIQLALGRRAERVLTVWEKGFLPEHLADAVADVRRSTADGRLVRLVAEDTIVFTAARQPVRSEAPLWLSMALLLGLTMAGLIAVLADSRLTLARVVLTVGVATWYGVTGIAGTALLLAATVTRHAEYMGANNAMLVANPLALVAMVVVPLALWRRRRFSLALPVALAIAVLSIAAVAVQLVPALRQQNGVVLATMVPVHVALAFAIFRLSNGNNAPNRSMGA